MRFPAGSDYTLSGIRLVRSSFATRYHLVSEPSPLPTITALGAWLRIPDFGALCAPHPLRFPHTPSLSLGPVAAFAGATLGAVALRISRTIWKRCCRLYM